MPSPNLVFHLNRLNRDLKQAGLSGEPLPGVRSLLSGQGTLIRLTRQPAETVEALTGGRPVAACDGSRVEYGSFFPYLVALERALGLATGAKKEIVEEGCCSPLESEPARELADLAASTGISAQEAYPRWLKSRLAARELKVATRLVEEFRPGLMMLDGGFLLFDTLPGWEELLAACKRQGTLLVGVIEEVATAEMAPRLGMEAAPGCRIYDRDLLYGQLERGEAFLVNPLYPIKKSYVTVFTRFGNLPAVAACDFLPGTEEAELVACLELLYATTVPAGRGIPFLLDLVDRKVRISRKEGEVMLKMGLEPAIYEKYFRAGRQRRYL